MKKTKRKGTAAAQRPKRRARLNVGLFVDGANHFKVMKDANIRIDYIDLLKNLDKEDRLIAARWYSGVAEHKGVQKILDKLSYNGFSIVTKPYFKNPDGTIKANTDIEITLDVVDMLPKLDRIILLSEDADFMPLVKYVQRRGVFVTIGGIESSCSSFLLKEANNFLDMLTVKPTDD